MPTEIVKVDDLKQTITDMILEKISQKYNRTDTSIGSPIRDIVLGPILEIAPILIEILNTVELRSLLTNESLLSDDEIDEIGSGNYFIDRSSGKKATGFIQVCFSSVSDTKNTVISQGKEVSSKQGLLFTVIKSYSFTPTEAISSYNPSTFTYDFICEVIACESGEQYNVPAGEVTKFTDADMMTKIVSVSNNASMLGGLDIETSSDYLGRIKNFHSSRDLEKKSGYENDIKSNFPEITDLYVAGKGDPIMIRDLAQSATFNGVTMTDFHLGGMVDIYVRTVDSIDTVSLDIPVNNTNLKLASFPMSQSETLVLKNKRTSIIIHASTISTAVFDGDLYVMPDLLYLGNPQWVDGDTIEVKYTKSDTTVATIDFVIKSTVVNLITPFITMKSVTKRFYAEYPITNGISGSFFAVSCTNPALKKSSREISKLTISSIIPSKTNPWTYPQNGDVITFEYTINKTIMSLGDKYDTRGDRIITRDLLFSSAPPKYIHLAIKVKIKDGQVGGAFHTSHMLTIMSAYMNSIKMGTRIDESDCVGKLYTDPIAKGFIEYVRLGVETFYMTSDPAEPMHIGRVGDSLLLGVIEYPILHRFEVTYI